VDVDAPPRISELPPGVRQLATVGAHLAVAGMPVDERRLRRALERRLSGRTVLVTGASRGIGRALARRVADAGAVSLLSARDGASLAALAEEIEASGGNCEAFPADLSTAEGCEDLIARLRGHRHRVEVLVNNAGLSIRRPIDQSCERPGDCVRTMEVNYFGAARLVLGLLPAMRAAGWGHIVNVSSIGLQTSMPRFSAYNASKAAIDAFVRSLAPEVAADGIRVTVAYLPLVRTEMSAPTMSFAGLPALTADAAAARLCRILVRRPARASSPIGALGELAALVAARRSQWFMRVTDAAMEARP
jgi:NAD(P)-dependent dehydrogenase (short-subunit alcohol dehydrogenase family)